MSNNDDFLTPANLDKTVILPNPGGAARKPPPPQRPLPPTGIPQSAGTIPSTDAVPAPSIDQHSNNIKLPNLSNIKIDEQNCVLGNCLPILCYAAQLRQMSSAPDLNRLFSELVMQIKTIGENLRNAGKTDDVIVTSRYLICSFIDEMVLTTPWGGNSNWSTQSLLSFFHKEALGGAKFFEILKRNEQQSARYIDVLELSYVCLSLGFLGKYRLQANGPSEISSLQENLYQHIRQVRQHQDIPLSSVTEGIDTRRNTLTKGKLLWFTAVISLAILLLSYGLMLFDLNGKSDPVANQVRALSLDIPPLVKKQRIISRQPSENIPLEIIAHDIARETLDIQQTSYGVKFILFGDGLFGSGSAKVVNIELIQRLASVLKQTQGPLKVIGHSDNIPIRTIEFPSNLHLSKKRAASIANILQTSVGIRDIQIEGLADLQPLVPNSNAVNRAKNRRVEILLFSH